ncbi:MAG: glycosyltransferase family 4 protein [Anaerolineae bacterium]
MLIGIDASRAALPQRTGTENYSLYLIRALLELGTEHHFRLYFNHAPAPDLFSTSEQVEQRIMPFPRLWTHLRLAFETALHPPDVLFVPSHVLPLVHPRCCVVTIHDLGYLYYAQAHTRFQRWYLDWSTRYNARAARRIIADSQATSNDLQKRYHVDRSKIVVAYPAGASGLQPITDTDVLLDCQRRYRTGAQYLLYLGSIQPRKNLPTLIRSFGMAVKEGTIPSTIRLVLAGKQGWLREDLEGIARDLGICDRFILTGYVPDADLAGLLSGALAYILPSYYEGFGLPVLEAMACGTPVICSNVSSLPEVAGDAAVLFDPRSVEALTQAITSICSDPLLRQSLSQRGLQRVRTFSWQACARSVLHVLETVGSVHDR